MEGAEAMRDEDDKLGNLHKQDGLDKLIDRALESYTPREPRLGLEQRILASVASASCPRPRGWNWKPVWALAGAALVATLAVSLVFKPSRPEVAVPHRPAEAGVERSAQAAPAFASSTQNTPNRGSRRSHAVSRVPLQTQFGQPRLTREELLMARFAAQEPESMEALAKSRPDLDAPVAIAAIPDNPIVIESVEMKPITITPIETSSLN
jgi:hypothetical protein